MWSLWVQLFRTSMKYFYFHVLQTGDAVVYAAVRSAPRAPSCRQDTVVYSDVRFRQQDWRTCRKRCQQELQLDFVIWQGYRISTFTGHNFQAGCIGDEMQSILPYQASTFPTSGSNHFAMIAIFWWKKYGETTKKHFTIFFISNYIPKTNGITFLIHLFGEKEILYLV